MTFEELCVKVFSVHPSNVQSELERLTPVVKEYEQEKERALKSYEMQCHNLAAVKHRLSELRYLKDKMDRIPELSKTIKEHDLVTVVHGEYATMTGTVVHVYEGAQICEVEFINPPAVLTFNIRDLELSK